MDDIDYLCQSTTQPMKEITAVELKSKMDAKEDFQLIDVREEYEYEAGNLGGELVPMAEILQDPERISRTKPVILHCRSGARSATAILNLEKQFGFTNLYNLKGGILAYARDVDPTIQV